MKIRTIEDLTDRLSNEIAWRKRELSDLKYYVELSISDSTRRQSLARCGVAILYAHWEGFVKLSSRYFLEFISMQRHTNNELKQNFLTMSMRANTNMHGKSRKTSEFAKVTSFFEDKSTERAIIPYKLAIDTESNLSSSVFKEIAWCLGIDYSLYETREKFIDVTLLTRRNHIAHGEVTSVDASEYDEMRQSVIAMMELIKSQLENSALTKAYLK